MMTMKQPAILMTVCGLNELDVYSTRGVTHVLSILDPGTPAPEVFTTYQSHARTTLRFHNEIDAGLNYTLPQTEHIESILELGRSLLAAEDEGRHVLVHCHLGISRSTAAMAALLAVIYPYED